MLLLLNGSNKHKENKEDIHFKEKLSNKTHKSKSDPDSHLHKKTSKKIKI